MHFKLTQEMKQRIIVYSASLIIAILFFTILNKFKDIKRAIQFILTILFPFLLGIGLAFILNNPQKWVEEKLLGNVPMRKNHKRILSTALVFILAIGFLILFFSIIIPNTIDSVRQFSKNVAVYSDTLIGYTKDFAYKLNISEKQVANSKYYYRLIYCHDGIILASFMDDTYATQFRDSLIDSTVYVIVIAFMIVFLIILMWVFSIIHPLNLIRNYIEQIKDGKEVELHLNRDDEIGEMATAIVKMNDELKKQDKAKEDMIHNISHDLKTPIATIKSYAESIKDGIYPYGTLESSVDVILDNAQRLENKVHSLLYMNRVEYLVASDAEGVVTNMKDVVEQVVLNAAVIRPEIQVITDVEEVFFDGLIEAWRVAIENIMENAFRYAKSYIKIEVREDWLCISNDGPKMPEDRIQSLFRPYEKGEGGRFGLGLSIVSKVCKANHYIVKGENSEDGVRFIIYRKTKKQKKKKENNWVKNKGEKA